jgi:cytochrome c-type biogenesis protein CcmH/NrfG
MVYLRNGIYAGAVESFKYEVRLNPKSFAGHLNLGQAYSYSNKPQEALKAFETARKLDPTVADTYLGLAFLNNTSERYPFAVQYLREYIQRSKQPGPGYAMLSRVYLNQREFDKAVEAGRKAVEAMPDSGSSWYNLGQAYSYRPGDTYLKEAAAAFEKANQLVPNWGGAHFELGRIYERMGRKDEALAQYREATRSAPTIGKFRYQLGRLLIQLGQTEEGRRTVAEAEETLRLNQREEQLVNKIAAFPKESRYLYELGQVYKELGETQKALSSFQAALDLQPNNAQYRAAMQEMRSRLPLR